MSRSIQSVCLLSFVSSFAFLTLVSCAHHRDVRPGADGINRVVLRGPDREPIERSAISQANHFCDQTKKTPAFVTETSKYTGSGDEANHKMMRRASEAVTAGGGMVAVFGGNNERNAGRMASGAGVVGGIMTDQEAYTVDMAFKCQ